MKVSRRQGSFLHFFIICSTNQTNQIALTCLTIISLTFLALKIIRKTFIFHLNSKVLKSLERLVLCKKNSSKKDNYPNTIDS